jgi:Transposase zinc-ribbon domain
LGRPGAVRVRRTLGRCVPRTPLELQRRFGTEEACQAYLAEWRLPDGFRCPRRGHARAWPLPGSPTTRVRLAWVPGLDDGGDRAPSDQAHRGAPAAGVPDRRPSRPDRRPSRPDRRPSRPVVSPTYAQGSCYGTNRVVAGAPGRLTGPAAPLPSMTRAAQPPGGDPRRSRSSIARTGRVSRKNRTTGRGDARAGVRGRLRESARASRVAISAPTSTSSSSAPIVATTSRPALGRFLTWARCGSRRPTTRSRGQGHPADHLHAVAEADRQAAAAQQAPSAGPRHPTSRTSPEATEQAQSGVALGGDEVPRAGWVRRCALGRWVLHARFGCAGAVETSRKWRTGGACPIGAPGRREGGRT